MAENSEKKNIRKPREHRLSFFGRASVIYAAILLAVIAVLLGILAAFLYTYEENLPEKTASRFVMSLTDASLAAMIEDKLGTISPFEDAPLVLARSEYLLGEKSTAKLAKEYTSQRPVFRIICGENDIGKITLKRSEKDALFGIARWEIDSARIYDEAVSGAIERLSINVCVPHGAKLSVNGRVADETHIIEKCVEYSGPCVILDENTKCDIYKFDQLCTLPLLETSYMTNTEPLVVIENEADWFSQKNRTFILTAPSAADIHIGGRVADSSLAVKGELGEALSEFERGLGDALPKTVSYLLSGERDKSAFSVSVNGEMLEGNWFEGEDGAYRLVYLYSDESKYNVSAIVPEGAVLYINGVAADEKYIVGITPYPSLSGVEYLAASKKPTGVHYEIRGLICEPEIGAELSGEPLDISYQSREKQTFFSYYYGASSAELQSTATSAAEAFTKAYFHYVANGAVGIEENYNALISLMKPQSPGFKQIRSSKSSFEFVNQGVYRIDLIEPKNFVSLSDNLFYCEVDFSVHLRFYRNEKLYEGTLSLVFVSEGETLLVCDMAIDSFN
ncbi:MAG: hypothetical protein IJ303_06500 [Clostridia bacterium]|nr:hypothetical protein [Clostridia bacterium]